MAVRRGRAFAARAFLGSSGVNRSALSFRAGDVVYSQGDGCESVMYLEAGEVTLSVRSKRGKQAIVGVLNRGAFFGEGGLAGQRVRSGTATASAPSTIVAMGQTAMGRLLRAQHPLSDRFISYLLARNLRIEEDLVDMLFNSAEKRLARTLLLLARYGESGAERRAVPKFSQEKLAAMVGTTRSRVNFFMNRFRQLGFITTDGGLRINDSLLSVVLKA
jgi:CRP/FNR family transcriptional regulator, cyclic AMP receptor protein